MGTGKEATNNRPLEAPWYSRQLQMGPVLDNISRSRRVAVGPSGCTLQRKSRKRNGLSDQAVAGRPVKTEVVNTFIIAFEESK